jgi:hypothetical protein
MVPFLMLAGALALAMALHRLRNTFWVIALGGGLWAALPFYNSRILANCSGDCGIRIDLLLVAPLLMAGSVLALRMLWRAWSANRRK